MLTKEETNLLEYELLDGHEYCTEGGGIYSRAWHTNPITHGWYLEISPVHNIDGAGNWTSVDTCYSQVRKPYCKIVVDVEPYHEE